MNNTIYRPIDTLKVKALREQLKRYGKVIQCEENNEHGLFIIEIGQGYTSTAARLASLLQTIFQAFSGRYCKAATLKSEQNYFYAELTD